MEVISFPVIHRCLRLLRLRNMVRAVLVPVLLAKQSQTAVHSSEGTASNRDGMHGVGKTWSKNALVHCNNQAVVKVVNAGYCKDPHLMQLLQCLFFITTFFTILVKAAHIAGYRNTGADAQSRNNMHLLFSQVPTANKSSTLIPTALIELLIHQQPDWTSQAWSRLVTNCLWQV